MNIMPIVAVVAVTSFGAGWQVQGWRHDAQLASDLAAQQAAFEATETLLQSVTDQSIEQQVATDAAHVTKQQEVIKYVYKNTNNNCITDPDWLRTYNSINKAP